MHRSTDERQSAEFRISLAAALASVVLSIVHISFDPLPNPDGVVYLLAAQAWLDSGYSAAASVYSRPLYSILIAWVHGLSGMDLLTSARCLDTVLIACLIVALQRLSAAVGGTVRVQAIVVVLALLLPELNGYRSFLLRDFGYWMFATLALACLVRYAHAPSAGRVLGFALLCGSAAMFRAEAVPFVLLMPIALLFGPMRRPAAAAALYVPVAIVILVVGVAATVASDAALGNWIPTIVKNCVDLIHTVPERLDEQVGAFATRVLDPNFHDYAAFGLAGGLAAMIAVHVANAASLPVSVIAALGIAKRRCGLLDRRAVTILWMAAGVTLLGLAGVLTARSLIQTRYAMPIALLLVVVAAFVIEHWYTQVSPVPNRRRLNWAAALVLIYYAAEGGYELLNSKQHFVGAANWLAHNAAPDARIFSDDLRILYLADRPPHWRVQPGAQIPPDGALPVDRFDYWVVPASAWQSAEVDRFAAESRLREAARFVNKKGNVVVVYVTRRDGD